MSCCSEFQQACSNEMEMKLVSLTFHRFWDGSNVRTVTVHGVVKIIQATIAVFLKDLKICWHARV